MDDDTVACRECGTLIHIERFPSHQCPTCTLAKTLGLKPVWVKGESAYHIATLTWVKGGDDA